jgi:hypothetical protein
LPLITRKNSILPSIEEKSVIANGLFYFQALSLLLLTRFSPSFLKQPIFTVQSIRFTVKSIIPTEKPKKSCQKIWNLYLIIRILALI